MKATPSHNPRRQAVPKSFSPDEAFFFRNAGFSYDPCKETARVGLLRCAKTLAKDEADARKYGISFRWEQDDATSKEFTNKRPFYALWYCYALDVDGKRLHVGLGGIDFGRDKEPWGNPYKREVEAELASEALDAYRSLLAESKFE